MNPYLLWYLILAGASYAVVLLAIGYQTAQDAKYEPLISVVGSAILCVVWPIMWIIFVGYRIGGGGKKD